MLQIGSSPRSCIESTLLEISFLNASAIVIAEKVQQYCNVKLRINAWKSQINFGRKWNKTNEEEIIPAITDT